MDNKIINNKMSSSLTHFEKDLASIRTSRASITMLDSIFVDCYGSKTPINQLGNISVPDANTLTIQIWDTNLIKIIENSIIESNLGLNPQTDGSLIRLPIPKLSEERRVELTKITSQMSENAKIVIRNIRREILEDLKNQEKEKLISQDELKSYSNNVQKITDDYVNQIEKITENKKSEIIKV